jgi:hypothetical protein
MAWWSGVVIPNFYHVMQNVKQYEFQRSVNELHNLSVLFGCLYVSNLLAKLVQIQRDRAPRRTPKSSNSSIGR